MSDRQQEPQRVEVRKDHNPHTDAQSRNSHASNNAVRPLPAPPAPPKR